jgi:hypothetical protein
MILFDRTDDRIVLAESLLTESLATEFSPILLTESAGHPAGRRPTSKTHKNNIVGATVSMVCARWRENFAKLKQLPVVEDDP